MKAYNALKTGDEWDFFGNDDPKCPHCGESHDVSDMEWWRLYEEGEHTVTCPDCYLEFEVSTRVSYSFSTDKEPT